MKHELVMKKCKSCGAMIEVLQDCNCPGCGIQCCGKEMEVLVPNSVDAAVEKHVPTYEVIEDEVLVKVNHVMEKEHYIEWIAMVKENRMQRIRLYPEQKAEVYFPYLAGATLYAYCNKHGLWKAEVN